MIPSEIRDRILEQVAPTPVARGFTRKSTMFSRQVGDLFHLIQLQASTDNTSSSAKFTVNVAVWVPALASDSKPSANDAHWRARLGSLGPEGSDLWWQANDFATADEAAREISRRIDEFALPALDRFKSTHDLLSLWRAGDSPGLTALQADRFRRRLEERPGNA